MTHLSQEQLILSYYGELAPEAQRDLRAHLDACAECRDELARLTRVLDQVNAIEVPEPADDYEQRTWQRLAWKLRTEKRSARGNVSRYGWLAAAAMLVMAILGGVAVVQRREPVPLVAAANPSPATPAQPARNTGGGDDRTRVLLVVVGDHFDESERVLVELVNLTPDGNTDITSNRERAEKLLASNRLYRRSAVDRGEESVATLLDELEPVLTQIAHAPSQLSEPELRRIQKRVEAKGLVFKLRVVRAGVRQEAQLPELPTI